MLTEFQVDQRSDVVADMAEVWDMIDTLLGGTRAMRGCAKKFLPQWPNEDNDSYRARVATATLFPAFERTSSVMAAKPFVRPLNWETEPPAKIAALLDNVDLLGVELQAYAYSLMRHVLQFGLVGVLVDYPTVAGVRTVADEKAAGARPYMAIYPAQSILGWRVERGPDGFQLAQLRLKETVTEPDGPWGEKDVEQARMLTPGAWALYRKNEATGPSSSRAGPRSIASPSFSSTGLRQASGRRRRRS